MVKYEPGFFGAVKRCPHGTRLTLFSIGRESMLQMEM
jgi:hypothetical protein